jgi:hypothetical protein
MWKNDKSIRHRPAVLCRTSWQQHRLVRKGPYYSAFLALVRLREAALRYIGVMRQGLSRRRSEARVLHRNQRFTSPLNVAGCQGPAARRQTSSTVIRARIRDTRGNVGASIGRRAFLASAAAFTGIACGQQRAGEQKAKTRRSSSGRAVGHTPAEDELRSAGRDQWRPAASSPLAAHR